MEPWQGKKVLQRLLDSYFGKRRSKILKYEQMSCSCIHAVIESRKKRYGTVCASMMHDIAESVAFTSLFGSNVLYFANQSCSLSLTKSNISTGGSVRRSSLTRVLLLSR